VRAAAGIAAEIMGLPEGDRQSRMLTYIRERVAQILDSKVTDMPVDRPLDNLGLDSLMAFELREEIKQSLEVDISLEVFLQDMTLVDLARTLTDRLLARAASEREDALQDEHLFAARRDQGLIEGAL
jgi:acyl carrier protein